MGNHRADGSVGGVEVASSRINEGLDDLRGEGIHPFQTILHVFIRFVNRQILYAAIRQFDDFSEPPRAAAVLKNAVAFAFEHAGQFLRGGLGV